MLECICVLWTVFDSKLKIMTMVGGWFCACVWNDIYELVRISMRIWTSSITQHKSQTSESDFASPPRCRAVALEQSSNGYINVTWLYGSDFARVYWYSCTHETYDTQGWIRKESPRNWIRRMFDWWLTIRPKYRKALVDDEFERVPTTCTNVYPICKQQL